MRPCLSSDKTRKGWLFHSWSLSRSLLSHSPSIVAGGQGLLFLEMCVHVIWLVLFNASEDWATIITCDLSLYLSVAPYLTWNDNHKLAIVIYISAEGGCTFSGGEGNCVYWYDARGQSSTHLKWQQMWISFPPPSKSLHAPLPLYVHSAH